MVEFNQLASVVLLFVLIGLVLGFGANINQEVANSAFDRVSVVNETVNFAANNTYYALSYPYVYSIDLVYNNTSAGNKVLTSARYDFAEPNNIRIFTNSTVPTGNKYVSYTVWNTSEGVLGAENILITKNATSGQMKLAEWLPIIAVVIAAGIVIGVLMTSFMARKEGGY